jgi:hypothetical protein
MSKRKKTASATAETASENPQMPPINLGSFNLPPEYLQMFGGMMNSPTVQYIAPWIIGGAVVGGLVGLYAHANKYSLELAISETKTAIEELRSHPVVRQKGKSGLKQTFLDKISAFEELLGRLEALRPTADTQVKIYKNEDETASPARPVTNGAAETAPSV